VIHIPTIFYCLHAFRNFTINCYICLQHIQRLSTVEFKRKFNVMQHKIPTPSGSTPGGLQVGSGWIPCRFSVDSGWVPGRLRVDSRWTPGGFRVDSGCIPGRRREGSGSARGGLRVGSDQVGLDLAICSAE
jgi:hypothetical protein